MTKPTAKDFDGAADRIHAHVHAEVNRHAQMFDWAQLEKDAALLRRLLDSGFLGAALDLFAHVERFGLEDTASARAFHSAELTFRRLTAEPSEEGVE